MTTDLNEFISNFSLVDNALEMRTLRRWNGRNLRLEENLSEHTHLVIACATYLYDAFSKFVHLDYYDIVKRCLLHDSLEMFRGDILSITKDSIKGLREKIDSEELTFYESQGSYVDEYEEQIVKLADLMACYKFIEYVISYPSNNFALEAYNYTKEKYESCYDAFCKNIGINIPHFQAAPQYSKGYSEDAGMDVVIGKKVTFLPMTTTTVDLEIKFTPETKQMGMLFARTSAAKKGLSVASCPIDPGFTGNITAIVHNMSNTIVTYEAGQSFCQLVCVSINDTNDVVNEIRKQGTRTDGKFGSTGKV